MATQWSEDDERVDPKVHCSACDAVCCRLTVLVTEQDAVPPEMVMSNEQGLKVMRRGETGWCVGLDLKTKRCGIYDVRPDTCRRFTMGSGYCRFVREEYDKKPPLGIPLAVID